MAFQSKTITGYSLYGGNVRMSFTIIIKFSKAKKNNNNTTLIYILLLKYWALIFFSCRRRTADKQNSRQWREGVDTRGCGMEDYVINWITGPLESIKPFDAVPDSKSSRLIFFCISFVHTVSGLLPHKTLYTYLLLYPKSLEHRR